MPDRSRKPHGILPSFARFECASGACAHAWHRGPAGYGDGTSYEYSWAERCDFRSQDVMSTSPTAYATSPSPSFSACGSLFTDLASQSFGLRDPSTGPESKKQTKGEKEKANRATQASIANGSEDLLQTKFEWKGRSELTAGNSNRSGLDNRKTESGRALGIWAGRAMQFIEMLALSQGVDHDEWQAWMRSWIDEGMEHDDLHYGTFLQRPIGEQSCRHEGTDKRCLTHGHADHRQCRKARLRRRNERAVRDFKAGLPQRADRARSPGITKQLPHRRRQRQQSP